MCDLHRIIAFPNHYHLCPKLLLLVLIRFSLVLLAAKYMVHINGDPE